MGCIELFNSGELEKRVALAKERLSSCSICPRKCGVNRLKGELGFCGAPYEIVYSSICDHHGEEPVLSGIRGAGCIFLSSCNLRCVYCQNWQISHSLDGKRIHPKEFANVIIEFVKRFSPHNIEWVNPSHYVPQILETIYYCCLEGLNIPFVYNTNAYDDLDSLKLLSGVMDVYLPDMKYCDDTVGLKYSMASSYCSYAKKAIIEMYRQVGPLSLDENGIAVRGMIVRHLVLPNGLSQTKKVLDWLKNELGSDISLSLMSQYLPTYQATCFSELSRPLKKEEYEEVLKYAEGMDFENLFIQPYEERPWNYYYPDFEKEHPFS